MVPHIYRTFVPRYVAPPRDAHTPVRFTPPPTVRFATCSFVLFTTVTVYAFVVVDLPDDSVVLGRCVDVCVLMCVCVCVPIIPYIIIIIMIISSIIVCVIIIIVCLYSVCLLYYYRLCH